MFKSSKLFGPIESTQGLVRGISTKIFHFPSVVEYSDQPLDKVNFHSIYGFQNLPRKTKLIINNKANEPVIQNLEHMNHYKKLFKHFEIYLSSMKNISYKTFARIVLNSIRLASFGKPIKPSIHEPGVRLKSILDQNFQIEFRKPFSNKEVEETTKSFIAQGEESGYVGKLFKIDDVIDFVTRFSNFHSFEGNSEDGITKYYQQSFLEPMLQFVNLTVEKLVAALTAQQLVEVDWLFDRNIFNNVETNTIKNAIKPDFAIKLKSKKDYLLSYMPIELKTRIGNTTSEILGENLKQSIFQCLLSGSGVAILTDARNSLFYKISDVKTDGKKVKVLIDYSFVNSSQINLTESKMFIYMINHLKKHHDELVQTGTSTASNLCAEIIKHIKRSPKEQKNIIQSYYHNYSNYLKSQPQNKNLTIYKLVIPKDATIEHQGDGELQQFKLTSEVLKKSNFYKGNEIISSTVLLKNSNDICITINDEILNDTYEVSSNDDVEKIDLDEELKLLSIFQKRQKFGFNNPYLAYGLIEIVRDDDEIVGFGQGFVTIEGNKKAKLADLQPKIKEQTSRFKQAAIGLLHPSENDLILLNGSLYLKALNMSPIIDGEKAGTSP